MDEETVVLGYDAKTGQAWRVKLPLDLGLCDAGIVVEVNGKKVTEPWSRFGP